MVHFKTKRINRPFWGWRLWRYLKSLKKPQNGPFSSCNSKIGHFRISSARSGDGLLPKNGPLIFWNGPFSALDAYKVTWPISVTTISGHLAVKLVLWLDRDLVMTFIWPSDWPLDWWMEAKWRRFWNFFESASYWKFCPGWRITNWKNCPNRKWRLWNILGCIWKSKRNPRTKIWLVIWWIEIIKCSMVLEY